MAGQEYNLYTPGDEMEDLVDAGGTGQAAAEQREAGATATAGYMAELLRKYTRVGTPRVLKHDYREASL